MREEHLIGLLTQGFDRSPLQRNERFEADAELIEIGDELWAITTDEFSPEEDRFDSADPELLGWNLAMATLSDLLAVGATPRFFLASLCLPRAVDDRFAAGLATGLRHALTATSCFLLGGDLGSAPSWRFCGTALGLVDDSRPWTRRLPDLPQELWVTGSFGDAAAAVLSGVGMPRFELRAGALRSLRPFIAACTDTSGGLFRSLWDLAAVSAPLRFEIDRAALPVAEETRQLLTAKGIPPEAALLAGAGEYELLFTIPEDRAESARAALLAQDCSRIGRATPDRATSILLRQPSGELTRMSAPPPEPRQHEDVQQHIHDVITMAAQLFRP